MKKNKRLRILADSISESGLSFFGAASIIVGHGVGAGILSVPYPASHNSVRGTLPGGFGTPPFRILVMLCTPAATVGAVMKVG